LGRQVLCKNLALLGHYALAVRHYGGALPLAVLLKFASPLRAFVRLNDRSVLLANPSG
jgi:hypothetical protein